MKATAEWFPAKERGLAGGVYNIGASFGSMLAPPLVAWAILSYNWRAGVRDHRRAGAGVGGAVAVVVSLAGDSIRPSPREETDYIASGQETHLRRRPRPSILQDSQAAQFLGHRDAALSRRSDLGHAELLAAALSEQRPALDLKQIALFAWLPFLAADFGCMFGGLVALRLQKRGLSLINARRWAFTLGACLMMGMGFVGNVQSPYTAIALLCLGGFAHQTLSVTVITMSSDLFRKNEVATVAGMAGTFGNAGLLIFSLLIGGLVADGRLHAVLRRLGVLDLVGAPAVDGGARCASPRREI